MVKVYDPESDFLYTPSDGEKIRILGDVYSVCRAPDERKLCQGCAFRPGQCSDAPVCIADDEEEGTIHFIFRKEENHA